MGFSIITLASLALGAAAQSTAGAYAQCKLHHAGHESVRYEFTDFEKVEALAIQAQALAAQDTRVPPTSENPKHQRDARKRD